MPPLSTSGVKRDPQFDADYMYFGLPYWVRYVLESIDLLPGLKEWTQFGSIF